MSSDCEMNDECNSNHTYLSSNPQKVRAQNYGSVLPTHVQDVGEFHAKLTKNPVEVGVLSEQVSNSSFHTICCWMCSCVMSNLYFISY